MHRSRLASSVCLQGFDLVGDCFLVVSTAAVAIDLGAPGCGFSRYRWQGLPRICEPSRLSHFIVDFGFLWVRLLFEVSAGSLWQGSRLDGQWYAERESVVCSFCFVLFCLILPSFFSFIFSFIFFFF